MSLETLTEQFQQLPPAYQEEVVHFIQFLTIKTKIEEKEDEEDWNELSLSSIMKEIEDEPDDEYSVNNLKERWK